MAETITIINNSGKIISTGKQLLGIFKDAKAAYHERKAHLKGPSPGIRRAQTFDVAPHQGAYPGYPPDQYDDRYYDQYDDYPLSPQHYQHQPPEPRCIEAPPSSSGRRRSVDDDRRSVASSQRSLRSHRSHRSSRTKHGDGGASEARRPPLTKSNLRTHSEVSSTAPSAVPRAYRSPYAETAPRDVMVSRPTLAHAATMPAPSQAGDAPRSMVLPVHPGPPPGGHADLYYNAPPSEASYAQVPPQQQALVTRPRSDPALRQKKSIDMDLAYGSVPPDLESRTDLEPREVVAVEAKDPEQEARSLMERIENMLIEAECLQHSAATIIDRLQTNPEAAAAVALTLAELSALLAKLGPGFLGVVKGGAPAVFALLASPQFLIAATAAVGVTVVMFGGFKIVKRMKEGQARQALPMPAQPQAIEMGAVPGYPAGQYPPTQYARTEYEPSAHPQDRDYAYGGHVPGAPGPGSHFDEALVVEEELSSIERWRRGIEIDEETAVDMELISPEALRSTIGDDAMSVRTKRTSKSHRRRDEVPDRKSSRRDREGEERSSRKGREGEERSRRKHKEERDDRSVAGSERSSRSKKSTRSSAKAIEDGSRDQDDTLESVLKPKEKKTNMLKSLFKKKERERGEVPVMA